MLLHWPMEKESDQRIFLDSNQFHIQKYTRYDDRIKYALILLTFA